MRSFKLVDTQPAGRYESKTPKGAASKAFTQLARELSNDNLNTSEQEKLKALIEQEDLEYSTALRQQQMELDKMVDEEVIDQYVINDSSNDYQLARYQSEMLAKDIDGLQNELEEENGILVKPDSRIEELLSKESDRPSV